MRRSISRAVRSRIAVLAAATLGVLLGSPASAQLYFDADGSAAGNDTTTGANLGGSGTWDGASHWFNGVNEVAWSAGSDAVFTGAGGNVTLGTSQSASSLSFKTDGFTVSGSTLTMDPSPANYIVDGSVTATIASSIAGSATMIKSGAGTLVLSNPTNTNTADTTSGGWRIDGGVLRIASDQSLGAPLPDTARNTVTDIQLNQSTIQFATSCEVDINRRTKVNTNSTSNLGDAIIDVNGNAVTWYGSIQGGVGSLHVTSTPGGGILVLGTDKKASVNPWGSGLPGGTVNLTISNGTVVQTSGQVTPTGGELGSETGLGGAPLAIKLETGGQIRSESGGYEFQRNLILGTGGGSLDVGAWNQTFLGTVTGSGTLGKYGTGTLVLDNPPAAGWTGGIVVHAGTLQLSRGGSNGLLPGTLASPGNVEIQSGATLKFFRGSDKSFFDVLTGSGNVTIANANNATVRLVADCNYTGLTTVSSGILMIGQGNPGDPGSIVSNVLNNSVLDFNRFENITYGGTISGTGSVVKESAGKLTLTGASSYGGGTTVMAGTLIAANSTGSATGSGSVDVLDGAVIAGMGKISGLIALSGNAHLAPGTSIGTLTTGSLSLSPNSVLDYELGAPASSDLTIITDSGGLAINGGILNITAASGFGVGEYPIFEYAGSFSGSVDNLSIGSAPLGYGYSFVNNAGLTRIDLLVTPEPGTVLAPLVFIGLLGLGRVRRRARFSSCRSRSRELT